MKWFWLFPVAVIALLVPAAVLAGGHDGGFNGVVQSVESRYHVRAMRIPLMGLVSFVSGAATHGGVGNLHIADFESFPGPVDGDELDSIVEERLGPGWERMIRETERHGDEQTLIFTRPEGQRMGLFIVDAEKNEMNIVQVSVNADRLAESIDHYGHHHHNVDTDRDDDDHDSGSRKD